MLEFINNNLAVASAATVVVLFVLRLMARSEGPTLWGLLPEWLDISTWNKWGLVGTVGQLAVTAALAGGTVLVAAYEDGVVTLLEIQDAGEAVLLALGFVTGVKQLSPARAARKQAESRAVTGEVNAVMVGDERGKDPTNTVSVTVSKSEYPMKPGAPIKLTALLLLMALPGCGLLQSAPVQSGLDAAEAVCNNTLLRSPDVQRMLIQSGVLPESVATVIESACAVLAATKPGLDSLLEQADKARAPRDRVLAAEARSRGLLP
jgi:hypothetical protein